MNSSFLYKLQLLKWQEKLLPPAGLTHSFIHSCLPVISFLSPRFSLSLLLSLFKASLCQNIAAFFLKRSTIPFLSWLKNMGRNSHKEERSCLRQLRAEICWIALEWDSPPQHFNERCDSQRRTFELLFSDDKIKELYSHETQVSQ